MDEWVTTALSDDQMVVELLLRIKYAGTVESENPTGNLPLLRWGFRQRRSRPSRLGVGVGGFLKKEMDSARASPLTPLCWSGGSGSGGSTCPSAATGDGFEDISRQASCSTSTGSGSKVLHAANEINSSCSKRSKKQKTFLELKDAENLQLKERLDLETEKRNIKDRSLKKIKLEYSDRIKTNLISKSNLDKSRKRRRLEFKKEQVSEEKGFFFLPDLNMTPNEEDDTGVRDELKKQHCVR